MSDSEQKKEVVNFSVRFDPDLFDRLESYLLGIKRQDRPSKDRFIQEAVGERIAAAEPEKSLKSAPVPQSEQEDPNRVDSDATPLKSKGTVRPVSYDSIKESEGVWVQELVQLIASSVGAAEDFRRLLAIHQSKDGKVTHAISCNLAIFALIETVARVLNERANPAVSTGKAEDLGGRVQAVIEESNTTVRDAGDIVREIEERRKSDERDRRGDLGDSQKSG